MINSAEDQLQFTKTQKFQPMDDKLIKEAMAEAGHKGGLKRAQTVSKAKRDKWSAKGGLNRGKHSKEQLRIWALKGVETRRRNKLNKS